MKPRRTVSESPHAHYAKATVFLGAGVNHDIYGNPETGQVICAPVKEGCLWHSFGDRLYFRTVRDRLEHLTKAGEEW